MQHLIVDRNICFKCKREEEVTPDGICYDCEMIYRLLEAKNSAKND
jgi:hypothetical protein